MSDSSDEELHLDQDMTSEQSATCVLKDQGTFEGGNTESKNPLLPHTLHRFPNYFFEDSEELTYSDDFLTHKSYDHKTPVYQRTHAVRAGSGHAGSSVAFDHSLRGGVGGPAGPAKAGPLFSGSFVSSCVRVSRYHFHSYASGSGAWRGLTGLHRHPRILIPQVVFTAAHCLL